MKDARKAYWDKSQELIEYCTLEELKILSQQATKELNKRMNEYLGKFDAKEQEKKLVRQARTKIRARRQSKGILSN